MKQIAFMGLVLAMLVTACSDSRDQVASQLATELAQGTYPGGHFQLKDDNSLRVLVNFNTIEIDRQATDLGHDYYGSRPLQLPDQTLASDRELLQGREGWLGTCRRDGRLEVWKDDDPDRGFQRLEESYTPLGIWPESQYPASDTCRLLEDAVLTTARDQSLTAYNYNGREMWTFLMGAPARLLVSEDEQTIWAASDDGYIYCLDSQGELLWKAESASYLAALLPDKHVVVSARDGGMRCLDADGNELWLHELESEVEELRSNSGLVWFKYGGKLKCIDADGNTVRVDWPEDNELCDLLIGPDGDVFASGSSLVPFQSGNTAAMPTSLFCYDSAGRQLWQYQGLNPRLRIIPAHNSQCWLFDPMPDGFTQHSLFRIGPASADISLQARLSAQY